MGVHGLCGRVPDSAGSICLPDEAAAWPGEPSGRNLLAKAHKIADFVLGKWANWHREEAAGRDVSAADAQQPRKRGRQLQNGKLLLLLIFITFNENLSKYFSYE